MNLPRRFARRSKNRSRGQALVEFAMVLPMFVLLLLILFDFGRVVYTQHTLTQDAREAARVGLAAPDLRLKLKIYTNGKACDLGDLYQCLYVDIRNAALRFDQGTGLKGADISGTTCNGTLPPDSLTGTCFYPDPKGIDSSGRVVVNISRDVQIITPIISQIVGGTFHITAQAISVLP